MTVNTATWLNHRKQFFKGFKNISPYCAKCASFNTSGVLWKGWHSIPAQLLRNEDEEYQFLKPFHPAPEHTVKPHPCYSNKWLLKHTIIMMSYCFYYKFERQGCWCSCDCFLSPHFGREGCC